MRPVPLFLNPTAGRGRAGRRLGAIEKLLGDAGVAVDIIQSTGVGILEQQVREAVASGVQSFIVAGGDGSVHEAVNGMMSATSEPAFGLVPTGTGNDFAKAAGIPLDWEAATRLLGERIASDSPARTIDVGRVNERYFANGAGIGFDAKVSKIARALNWPIGDFVYLVAVFKAMVDGIITPDMSIDGDNAEWRGPLTLANVSNGPWVGGMFHIAPMADHADGELDLVIAAPVTVLQILRLLPKLIRGTHIDDPRISCSRAKRLRITSTAPVPSHLDGEIQPPTSHFDIEILPGALRLL